jgi:hypothetical protein
MIFSENRVPLFRTMLQKPCENGLLTGCSGNSTGLRHHIKGAFAREGKGIPGRVVRPRAHQMSNRPLFWEIVRCLPVFIA